MPVAQIPMVDYKLLVQANPDLRSHDAEIRTKAWLTVLKGLEKYRTVAKNLVPDSMHPDAGSIILPGRIQKQLTKPSQHD